MTVADILRDLITDNKQSRERFAGLAVETGKAIYNGDRERLTAIVVSATGLAEGSDEEGNQQMEHGVIDRAGGVESNSSASATTGTES